MTSGVLPRWLLSRRRVTASGCWEWTGTRTRKGYGEVWREGKSYRVHRLVAHLVHGLDLSDRDVVARHRCDNPPCFNPEHIVPGTHSDNLRDSIERGRRRYPTTTCCRLGHPLSGHNRLTGSDGYPRCRICTSAAARKYSSQRKAREGAFWARPPVPCPRCGTEVLPNNLNRHQRTARCRRITSGQPDA